jgi:hypothetical protein
VSVSTVDHISYVPEARTTPVRAPVSALDAREADEAHVRALSTGEPLRPDPGARARIAGVLYEITGWEAFSSNGDRAYVSHLWSEDWDSPEDAAYDDL